VSLELASPNRLETSRSQINLSQALGQRLSFERRALDWLVVAAGSEEQVGALSVGAGTR
jgi:hypothetical protein